MDDNDDGELTLGKLLKHAGDDMTDEMVVTMFKRCVENNDKDKDDFLTSKELKILMLMMQPGEDEKEL